ncbi:contractile injection system tape measure protein [Sphingomonas pokkalii]|uniref:Uncharacterized protein n=1 Tax=Sphingomonas pokkalii TaxID=2175090 RepID=A0A2U0SFD5_9SPHN|nr:contractile injection system tape measure protein [Sphingomonas pokkalii]PVX30086.1 hypothetical protein DD559_12715 [Sphingomonas pokkalii]
MATDRKRQVIAGRPSTIERTPDTGQHSDHRIGAMDVRVAIADMASATALRSRLEKLASVVFPAVIEQVFDGLPIDDDLLEIDRLDLDLGNIAASTLEADAAKALRAQLSDQLATALHRARQGEGAAARLREASAGRLHRLEAYLLHGVTGFAGAGVAFDLAAEARLLARERPAALVAMMRTHGRNRRFLERLVLQSDPRALRHWLRLLAPRDAVVILALLMDIELVHRRAPIAVLGRLPQSELRRMLWLTTLEFLLRDAGSDFNRRRFLAALIGREAARLGLSLDALLALFAEAVEIAAARAPLRSSLPGTLWALLAERRGRAGEDAAVVWAGPGRAVALAAFPGGITASGEQLSPADRALLAEAVERLFSLHVADPLADMDLRSFKILLEDAVHAALVATSGQGPWRRQAAWKRIVRRLAQVAEQSPSAMAGLLHARLRAAQNPAAISHLVSEDLDRRSLVQAYLQRGTPEAGGAALAGIGASDPEWLVAEARACAIADPLKIRALAVRMLDWLMPGELVPLFDPPDPAALLRFAQMTGGGDRPFWEEWLMAALRGEPGPAPKARDHPRVHRPDRLATFRTHLDEADTRTELEIVAARMSPAAAEQWLLDLAEAAPDGDDPLQIAHAARDADARRGVLLRAAAAGLAGKDVAVANVGPSARRPRRRRTGAADSSSALDRERLLAWLDGAEASAAEAEALVALFQQLADTGDEQLIAHLKARRGSGRARLRWATVLPTQGLGRLIHLLAPAEASSLVDGALLLAAAWRQTATFGSPRPTEEDIWKLLLDRTAQPGRLSVPALLQGLMRDLAGKGVDRLDKVRRRVGKLASDGGHATLTAAFRRAAPVRRPQAEAKVRAEAGGPQEEEPAHPLYVGNAGLVLLNPFLPSLFERLGLLTIDATEKPLILPGADASRAVHLLQYLAEGRLDRSEPELVLNKLLCGLPTGTPIVRSIEPVQSDLDICDDLLRAVIANWPKLDQMTVDALQETFLVREGRLQYRDDRWRLRVERKALDVLTDRLPWSFSVLYHRWMAAPIHVTW